MQILSGKFDLCPSIRESKNYFFSKRGPLKGKNDLNAHNLPRQIMQCLHPACEISESNSTRSPHHGLVSRLVHQILAKLHLKSRIGSLWRIKINTTQSLPNSCLLLIFSCTSTFCDSILKGLLIYYRIRNWV